MLLSLLLCWSVGVTVTHRHAVLLDEILEVVDQKLSCVMRSERSFESKLERLGVSPLVVMPLVVAFVVPPPVVHALELILKPVLLVSLVSLHPLNTLITLHHHLIIDRFLLLFKLFHLPFLIKFLGLATSSSSVSSLSYPLGFLLSCMGD